jgi:hypothetical protein
MQSTLKENYTIELPNDKAATYRVVTFIIALVNVLAFVYLYFNEVNKSSRNFAGFGSILSITALVFYLGKVYTKNLQTFQIEIAFLILAFTWFICGHTGLFFLMLVFSIFGWYANKKLLLYFDEKGISYPSFPSKTYTWDAVDFVLLKDGILTIELKNNRIFQLTLSAEETARLEEDRFNDFCKGLTIIK